MAIQATAWEAAAASGDSDAAGSALLDGLSLDAPWEKGFSQEDPRFLARQLVTYIGNKRALLAPIRSAIEAVRRRTGKDKLRILDAFSGSGVVSRMFKQYSSELIVNDIEDYARVVNECYLTNRSQVPTASLRAAVERMNRAAAERRAPHGFISRLYAPADAAAIQPGERVFYTPENAYRLDAYRQLLAEEPQDVRALLLGPLLSEASIHANTAGVFKGFYKDRATGVGKFGGSGADALSRITAAIALEPPVLSRFECDSAVFQQGANELVRRVGPVDVAYLDPPYNQHPYGSNYFMLNLIVNYEEPAETSHVSGIPTAWRRSPYNVRSRSLPEFQDLVNHVEAQFLIVSFNDEGFISPEDMRAVLTGLGSVTEHRQPYATFRGCRNLRNRNAQVTEHVYLVERR
jgi:adenine-specific DNA-methyltransferase